MVCKVTHRLHVHHTTYKNLGNEQLNELLVLCGECHRQVHLQFKIATKSFNRINKAISERKAVLQDGLVLPASVDTKKRRKPKRKDDPKAWFAAVEQKRIVRRLEKQRIRGANAERKRLQQNKVYNPFLGTWSSKPA
jgi:hypothetical protein